MKLLAFLVVLLVLGLVLYFALGDAGGRAKGLDGPATERGASPTIAEREGDEAVPPSHASEEIAVRVVNQAGEPVFDVPVALLAECEDHGDRPVLSGITTAPDGRMVFRDYLELVDTDDEHGVHFAVILCVLGVSNERTEIEHGGANAEPIALTLRETGSVEVRVVDDAGDVMPVAGTVVLRTLDANGNPRGPDWQVALVQGRGHVPHVGVGASLGVTVRLPSRGAEWTAAGPGPTTVGVPVVIDVLALDYAVLTGRTVDEAGTAVGRMPLFLHLLDDEGRANRINIATAEDGRFRAEVEPEPDFGAPVRLVLLHYGKRGWDRRADADLPAHLGATYDLGEVTLREIAGWIAGRCVDEAGMPVADVTVSAPEGFVDNRTRDRTDSEGRFELRGLFADETALDAEAMAWVPVNVNVVHPGDDEVAIVLAPAGAIVGTVRIVEGFDREHLVVRTRNEADDDASHRDWRGWVAVNPSDGSFRVGGLAAGTYLCSFERQDEVLLEVPGVVVLPPQETRDARLQDVDLSPHER